MLRFIMVFAIAHISFLGATGAARAGDEFSSARHYPGLTAKWNEIQSRMTEDAAKLALCRSDPLVCRPEEAQFVSILDTSRGQEGRARIGHINRAVNLAIRPISDFVRFGVIDRWSAPIETLRAGGGDCEDYAILKFLILREAGFSESELKLLVVRQTGSRTDHAVLAVRSEGEWLLLDNRGLRLVRLGDSPYRVLAQFTAEPAVPPAGIEMASATASDLPPLL